MEINVSELGPCRRKVDVDVPANRVKQEFDKSYKELASGMNIPGFRKGRVPRAVLRKKFGERIDQQVKATLLHELLKSIIEDHKLDPVKDPDIDVEALEITDGQPFKVEIELEVKPDFEIGEYKGLEVEGHEIELDEEKVQETLEVLRKQKADWAPIDGQEIAAGDYLVTTLKLTAGEEVVDESENMPLLVREGSAVAHIGLEHETLIGKKVGDEASGEAELGDDYPAEEHRGKSVSYTLTVNAHKRRELPELDEDFFGEFDCETLDELKDKVRHKLEHDLAHDAQHVIIDRLVDQLLAGAEFEIPDSVMTHERQRMERDIELQLRQEQVAPEELEALLEERMAGSEEEILRKVRQTYILERIAREEELEATEEEVEGHIAGMAQQQGMWPNEMREMMEKRGLIDQVYSSITLHKAQHFLLDHAKIAGEEEQEEEQEQAAAEAAADQESGNSEE